MDALPSDMRVTEVHSDGPKRFDGQPYWRRHANEIIHSQTMDSCMAVVILLNVAVMILDTDRQASCIADPTECESTLSTVCNMGFLVIYTLELLLRFFASRCAFFRDPWNLMDSVIVTVGIVDIAVSQIEDLLNLPNISMLRLFRLARLSRIIKLLKIFPTLYTLVRGFAGAMEAIVWGWALIVMLLTIWSLIAVDLIYPVALRSDFAGDPWCPQAFETVVRATLYFMQTLVAGDSWGACSLPIMRQEPLTFFVFSGALVSVQLGFTNLILAIIVDKASAARDSDNEDVVKQKRNKKLQFVSKLRSLLQEVDLDSSGTISLDEMLSSYTNDPHVRESLNLMDVDRQDIRMLFELLGAGRSEEVKYDTFLDIFQKAQLQDVRVYLMVMKLQVHHVMSMVEDIKMEVVGKRHKPMLSGASFASFSGFASEEGKADLLHRDPLPQRGGAAANAKAQSLGFCEGAAPHADDARAEASAVEAAHSKLESLEQRLMQQLSSIVHEAVSDAAALVQQAVEADLLHAAAVPSVFQPKLLLDDAVDLQEPKSSTATELPATLIHAGARSQQLGAACRLPDGPPELGAFIREQEPQSPQRTGSAGASAVGHGAEKGSREAGPAAQRPTSTATASAGAPQAVLSRGGGGGGGGGGGCGGRPAEGSAPHGAAL